MLSPVANLVPSSWVAPWVEEFREMTNYLVEDLMYGYVYDGSKEMILDPGKTPLARLEAGAIFTVICSCKAVSVSSSTATRKQRYFTAHYTLVLCGEQMLLVSNGGGPCTALPDRL